MISMNDLDAVSASEQPFEFEYIGPDGKGTDVYLQVLGGQSEKVTREITRLVNERRRQELIVQASRSRPGETFISVEDDIVFGHRLTAVRLVGWRGIEEPCTPANALRLVQTNRLIAEQVLEASNSLENFMRASPNPSSPTPPATST